MERYPFDRRICTVLFADVHGYTAMSEKLDDPEKVTEIMNDCFTRLTRRIVEMGGSIDKYSGDNVMARFGAPMAHEDDPERAVRAALAMQEELSQFSIELQQKYGVALEMRVGLNTGEVLAGEVGGLVDGVSYRAYTVMGDPVNLASRLEHEARVGHILVSEETYKLSKHAFDFTDLGFKQIRGKREPIHCYEVRGPKMQRQNRRGLAGSDIPVLGRDAELEILWSKLQEVVQGRSQVASVIGEAGVGKSSLLREFRKRLNAHMPDVDYFSGTAFSYASGQYFSLLRNVLFKVCKLNDTDNEEMIRRQLLSTIALVMGESNAEDASEYGMYAALLGRVMGQKLPNPVVDNLEPQQRSQLLTESLADFLLKRSELRPLVLVFDDLHWADNESLLVIDTMIRRALGKGEDGRHYTAMILLLHRPEFSRDWPIPPSAADRFTALQLERLTPTQVEAVARQFLNTWFEREREQKEGESAESFERPPRRKVAIDAPLPPVLSSIIERANGNAFFIEEILKSLLDAGKIVAVTEEPLEFEGFGEPEPRETWQIEGDLSDFKLPETLQEVLFARVDKLTGYNKQVLQVASVIGTRFEQRLLLSVEDFTRRLDRVEQALGSLRARDLIYTEREFPDPEYGFRHALTREVAYSNLLAARRRVYHEQIGRALERFKADRLQDYTVVDDLAYHFKESGDDDKAILYLTMAGHMRKNLYRNDEAFRAFDEARLRLLARLEREHRQPTVEEQARLVDYYVNLGDIQGLKTDYYSALDNYRAALALCSDQAIRLDIWAKMIQVNRKLGAFDKAIEAYEQANVEYSNNIMDLVEHPQVLQLQANLFYEIGQVYVLQGGYDAALKAYQDSLKLLDLVQYAEDNQTERRGLQIDKGTAYYLLGQLYEQKAELVEAEDCLQKAAQLHQQARKLDKLARVYLELGIVSLSKGDFVKAEQYFKQTRETAQKSGDVEAVVASNGNLGYVFERQGRFSAALKCFQALESSPNPWLLANALINSSRILLQQGQYEEALSRLEISIQYGQAMGSPELIAEANNNLGWIQLINKNWVDARQTLDIALEKGREVNNPEYLFYSRLFRAELALKQGDLDEADLELTEAEKQAGELGNPIYNGQLLRLQGQVALQRKDYAQAERYFYDSLAQLEPLKAYLEISYTKLYLAHSLWHKTQFLSSNDTGSLLRQVRLLLNQAVITFEACEVTIKQEDTEELSHHLEMAVA
jgi:class 3 adenylate cyclase/predicted ATPase